MSSIIPVDNSDEDNGIVASDEDGYMSCAICGAPIGMYEALGEEAYTICEDCWSEDE